MSIICPRCKEVVPDNSAYCLSCGLSLETLTSSSPVHFDTRRDPIQSQQTGSANLPFMVLEKRYEVLRAISTFLTVLAWIYLIVFGFSGLQLGLAFEEKYGFYVVLAGILIGVFMFCFIKAYAELLQIAIDIEENTRLTAKLIKRRQ